tara:strand:+ start:14547 stop:15074 length:528 start_codon:yes stop_codon:yes gene_type:complete
MNVYLVQILEKDSFDQFTISELKEAYQNISGDPCPKESRKFVYKQILRLVRHKVITKSGDKHSHSVTYKKTSAFSNVDFINKPPKMIHEETTASVDSSSYEKGILTSELDNILQQYKVDMMAAIGESEEYIRLLNDYPEMKNILSESYHSSRDNSSKLLGKIKAIKTILSFREQS